MKIIIGSYGQITQTCIRVIAQTHGHCPLWVGYRLVRIDDLRFVGVIRLVIIAAGDERKAECRDE